MKSRLPDFALSFSLLCLIFAGCTSAGENPVTLSAETNLQLSATVTAASIPADTATLIPPRMTPTKTEQPLPSSTPTPVQLVFPAVTMSPEEAENSLLELLKTNGNCTGKCVAGIWPDEMTVQEAVDIMAQWGMVKMAENSQGKIFIHLAHIPLYEQVFVKISIGTWTQELVTIDKLSVFISGPPSNRIIGEDLWLEHRDAWQGFSLANILKTYGIPTYVGYFFQTTVDEGVPLNGRTITYSIEIQYTQSNLIVDIGALAYDDGKNIFLCPSKDPHNLGIEINPERSLAELQAFRPVTWQALTGTDLEAFYSMFTDVANSDGCITTTLEQIQALQPDFR